MAFEGDEEGVYRRFLEHLAFASEMTLEEMDTAVDAREMPRDAEGLAPVSEFVDE